MTKKIILALMTIGLLVSGCSLGQEEKDTTALKPQTNGGYVMGTTGVYDSVDTAIVMRKDEGNNTITFQNIETGKKYTLTYDRTTHMKDKYEEGIAIGQIMEGDIVDVTFYKVTKRLNSIMLSQSAWSYSEVSKFEIGENEKSMRIVDEQYKISSDVAILSEGRQVEVIDLNAEDVLTVKGIDHTILSIVVDKGHGYLRLINDEYFIGGWIEVGQELIQPITEEMLLVVPEGTYDVAVSHKGGGGIKEVTIDRNGEVELDIGDLKGEEPKVGNVIFTVTPENANVYIDGKEIEIGAMIPLEYGVHQMILKASGYQTIRQYVKVGEELATIDVEMEQIAEEEEESKSVSSNETESKEDNTANGNTGNNGNSNDNTNNNTNKKPSDTVSGNNPGTSNGTANYKVKIESPVGAEVYLNGNYIGIVPASFKKVSGNHTVTLRKSGYQTRSYSIQVDTEKKDITYSFSDLEKAE